jgi:hypothetical protein
MAFSSALQLLSSEFNIPTLKLSVKTVIGLLTKEKVNDKYTNVIHFVLTAC